eukprot:TRINITY_DN76630_c0_g1_i1.p1 TRINITY_DN76630_c0_g1~~TRINITY_DN76630_c0_g1_i1.p1  ORF type:complete len:1114 (+),score=201.04 TRINITY_DN76630_c0_g1_i1:100-3441(+)
MRLTLDADGIENLPQGCYVSLQVGDDRQMQKISPSCHFDFKHLHQMTGDHDIKVEIFESLGACNLTFSTDDHTPATWAPVSPEKSCLQGLRLSLGASPMDSGSFFGATPLELFGRCCSGSNRQEHAIAYPPTTSPLQEPQAEEVVNFLDDSPAARMLVLTDVGEEIDDEAALWLLSQHLNASPTMEADVVFVTGIPMERATRWATVLNSQAVQERCSRLRYFVGPESSRHMRYRVFPDAESLLKAGLADVIQQPFLGGEYDVVLQLSPLGGFSDVFDTPPAGMEGSLARIKPRLGSKSRLHIIVGAVGATNYPRDSLHFGFQQALEKQGFKTVHVEKSNYMNWQTDMFETFPPKLTEVVLDDEWNKAVGRIPPFAANQLVRFRVNTNVNYDVVDRAYAAFEQNLRSTPIFTKATKWWTDVERSVRKFIQEGYIKMSRDADGKSNDSFGNEKVCENVKGMIFSWESILSRTCIRDILASSSITESSLPSQLVDDVLCHGVVLMTSKLLKIYAFNRYISDREPEMQELEPYLRGTKEMPPLDFRSFPPLHGDISSIQKEVVGNPMYDPAGMLVALVALSASEAQIEKLVTKLTERTALLGEEQRLEAMKAVYRGEQPRQLNRRFFETDQPAAKVRSEDVTRVLVLTDAGDETDSLTAMWLLSQYLASVNDVEIDVVFTTSKPILRAMRWARVLNSIRGEHSGQKHMFYFLGPETPHEMRYFMKLDEKELTQAGMEGLADSHFDGGAYSIIMQASPLSGFSDNLEHPPDGPHGALGRLQASQGKSKPAQPLYIVVGEEGSINFPRDDLHQNVKNKFVESGFLPVYVSHRNYVNWGSPLLETLPATLKDLALRDEWNKAVGRIPPHAANLFLRFRVNTSVNYVVVNRAYCAFVKENETRESFMKALAWWQKLASGVKDAVMNKYVKASRAQDGTSFGNPKIKETVKGDRVTWRAVMSDECVKDILETTGWNEDQILEKTVDEIMGHAVTLITGKLLRIYAHCAYDSSIAPNDGLCMRYVCGSDSNPPLDFVQFPRLLSDIGPVQRDVAGNPMYDTSAALVLLGFLQASKAQADYLIEKLSSDQSLLPEVKRNELATRVFEVGPTADLAAVLCGGEVS